MVHIKESNYWAIHDFALLGDRTRIQGSKLEALHRLIQKKGEPMESKSNAKLNGLMVLDYSNGNGSMIGLDRSPVSKTSFFPCKIDVVAIQKL